MNHATLTLYANNINAARVVPLGVHVTPRWTSYGTTRPYRLFVHRDNWGDAAGLHYHLQLNISAGQEAAVRGLLGIQGPGMAAFLQPAHGLFGIAAPPYRHAVCIPEATPIGVVQQLLTNALNNVYYNG
jgi:hypothetical protein